MLVGGYRFANMAEDSATPGWIPISKRIRDDRGRVCRLEKPTHELDRTRKRAAKMEIRWCDWRVLVTLWGVPSAGLALWFVAMWTAVQWAMVLSRGSRASAEWLLFIVFFGGLLVWMPATGWLAGVFLRPHRVKTRLRAGMCASCCYVMSGLPGAEDGCTVCPECGSAWKMPRLTWAEQMALYPWWWRWNRRWRDDRGGAMVVDRTLHDRLREARWWEVLGLALLIVVGGVTLGALDYLSVWLRARAIESPNEVWARWPIEDVLWSIVFGSIAIALLVFFRPRRTNRVVVAARRKRGHCGACDLELPKSGTMGVDGVECSRCGAWWAREGRESLG